MACVPEGKIIGAISPVPLLQTETILQQMKKSVCRISCNKNHGTGFFCKIEQNKKKIPVLITNYHIIDDETVDSGEKIKCYLGDEKTLNLIKVDKNRKIYSSSINKYDIMILNIYDRDNIKNINYLELDDYLLTSNSFDRYESIYMLHYPSNPNITVSYGNGIEKKDKFSLKHKCYTSDGSSGAPILDLITNKVIGIHKGAGNRCQTQDKEYYNLGTFLKDVIMDMNFQYINKINNQFKNTALSKQTSKASLKRNFNLILNDNNKKEKDEKKSHEHLQTDIHDNISNKDLNLLKTDKKINKQIIKIKNENRVDPKNYKKETNKSVRQQLKKTDDADMPNPQINNERKKNDPKNNNIKPNQTGSNFYQPNLNNNIKKDYLNNGNNLNQRINYRNEAYNRNEKSSEKESDSDFLLDSRKKMPNYNVANIQSSSKKKKYNNNIVVTSKYINKKKC